MESQEIDPRLLDASPSDIAAYKDKYLPKTPPAENRCDESKCVSQGGWNLFSGDTDKPFVNPFTCYGDDGKFYPRMCADGYLPMVVEDEPPLLSADWYADLDADIPVSYFTCCPPPSPSSPEPAATTPERRRCSDPVVGLADETSCSESEHQGVSRQQKTSRMTNFIAKNYTIIEIDSYLCCDDDGLSSDSNTIVPDSTNTNYLNDTECVPYRSPDYDGFLRENAIGHIVPITCDFPDGSFSVPRPSPTDRFQCCRSGTPMPPYVTDTSFYINVYPILVLWIVVALLSAIGVTALLIPLAKELRNRNRRQSQKQVKPRFSSYNLYLVYLMFLDLVFAVFNIGMLGDYVNQNYNPELLEGVMTIKRSLPLIDYRSFRALALSWAYTIGNFWLNAIILHQVLFFLVTFRSGRRVKPPCLFWVNLTCGAVYALVLLSGVTFYVFCGLSRSTYYIGVIWWQALVYPPMFYIFSVPIRIWWKGYMPTMIPRSLANPTATTTATANNLTTSTTSAIRSLEVSTTSTNSGGQRPAGWRDSGAAAMNSLREQALRELALYFLRIVFVFLGLWFPSAFLMYAPLTRGVYWTWLVVYLIYAITPIVSFGFILTKSDVRQYIVDLLRCSAFRSKDASSTDMVPRSNFSSTPASQTSGDPSYTINISTASRMGKASRDTDSDPEEGRNSAARVRRESTCFFQLSKELSEPYSAGNNSENYIIDDTRETSNSNFSFMVEDDSDELPQQPDTVNEAEFIDGPERRESKEGSVTTPEATTTAPDPPILC